MEVTSRWQGAQECHVQIRDFELYVDEPPEYGGRNKGPQPTELLLASIASCFTLSVVHVARKHSKTVSDLFVTARGEYDGLCFKSIRVEVSASVPPAELKWLVVRARRFCYVSNTLIDGCKVDYVVSDGATHV